MTLLACATHVVRDLAAAVDRFQTWLDYTVVEQGEVPADLAAAWLAPASAGRTYAILQPASGADVFLRFVEGDLVEAYLPIRTYGWAAIEICVQDVMAVNARMLRSPFDVIGPPTPIAGFPTIYPMQVRGADQETVYLTEIKPDGPEHGLPVPATLIDKPFILVLACADMAKSGRWFADVLGLAVTDPVAIRYRMIANAFGLPIEQLHEITTASWEGQFFLELDQYPDATIERPRHDGALPPGVAICTLLHPEFERFDGQWASEPVIRQGALYQGRRAGLLQTPEGALLELIDSRV